MENHKIVETRIKKISIIKNEDVYDITTENNHNFFANNILVHNCGELPLNPGSSCILILMNLTSYVDNPYTDKAKFNYILFEKYTKIITRLIDDMIDLEIEKVKQIIAKIENDPEDFEIKKVELNIWKKILQNYLDGRRVGIGITGLADMLAMLDIKYASDDALKKVEKVFSKMHTTISSEQADLAKERGKFKGWDWNKEKDCSYIKILPKEIQDKIQTNGRRNISFSTLSPAGSMSILAQCSSGVEPVYQLEYMRKKKLTQDEISKGIVPDLTDSEGIKWTSYVVQHHGLEKWKSLNKDKQIKDSPYYNNQAKDIDWKFKVKLQACIQKYITHSISNTYNLPKDISKDEVSKLYLMAWKDGCKGVTIYREGSRDGVLTTMVKESQSIIESMAPKRPELLECDIKYSSIDGHQWVFFVGILNGRPYEIFGGKKDKVEIPKKYKKGWIKKNGMDEKRRMYDLYLGTVEDSDDRMIIKDIAASFSTSAASYTRIISMLLRHGVPINYICDQLNKDTEANMFCFEKSISRVIKHYIKDGELSGNTCDKCNEKLIYKDGCVMCPNCGYSKC